MAEFTTPDTTPTKVAERKENCRRCCNTNDNLCVYIYGEKSKSDWILIALKQFTRNESPESDELSSYLWRSCVNRVLHIKSKIKELKSLFEESE